MRLLFLVSSLPIKKIGGTEIITLRICDKLAGGSHETFIYTIPLDEKERSEETLSELFQKYGIRNLSHRHVLFSQRVNSDQRLSYTRANLSFIWGLKKVVKETRPDVVVSMTVQPPEIFCHFLPSVLRKMKVPYVFMVRGFTDLMNAPDVTGYGSGLPLSERIKNRIFYTYLLPRYVRTAADVVVQTTSKKDYVLNRYGREACVLFNPIDVETIQHVIESNSKDAVTPERDEEFRLVYVGSMKPSKDLETLLRSVRFLVHEKKDDTGIREFAGKMMLYLIGGGRGYEKVKSLVEKLELTSHVLLKGVMQPKDIWPFLRECDVFVFPTLSEGFPNVLLEAMACSLPIISSDFAGVEDVIRSEKNGLLFRRKDAKELAEKVMYMYENKTYRNEVGSYNQQFVRRFSWENFIAGFEKVLERVSWK